MPPERHLISCLTKPIRITVHTASYLLKGEKVMSSSLKVVRTGYKWVGGKMVPVLDQRINMPFASSQMEELKKMIEINLAYKMMGVKRGGF
jgi:hypothetical protein